MKNTGVENEALENVGPNRRGGKDGTKSHGWKRQDWKTRDQSAWVEFTGLENAGPNFRTKFPGWITHDHRLLKFEREMGKYKVEKKII